MSFKFIRADITKLNVEAIVASSNKNLKEGMGGSRSIYIKAGEQDLINACNIELSKKKLNTSDCVITGGFKLCKYIIHAVTPKWEDGNHHEITLLHKTYENILITAFNNNIKQVAIPFLGTGYYAFPKKLL